MTQGESPTFTDMGMGDCSGSGLFGPCSMDDIFGGSFFFSHNWDLPFEVKAFRRNSRDNPWLLNLLSRSAGFLPTADSVPLLIGESIELVPWRLLLEHEGRLHAKPPRHKPWYIVGFNNSERETINDQVKSMYGNEACAKAFKAAGLQSVNTIMNSGSLIFVYDGVLLDARNDSRWPGDSSLREGILALFEPSLSANGAARIGPYNNGNYYISLRGRAFTGWDDKPINIIIHELIHVGGAPRKKDPFLVATYEQRGGNYSPSRIVRTGSRQHTPRHDLEWLNYENGEYVGHYDKIIKACQPPKT